MATNDPDVTESILNSIKKLRGVSIEDPYYDPDLILHINAGIGRLDQLADLGRFTVSTDAQTWTDYLGVDSVHRPLVEQYLYMKVTMAFDMPATSFAIAAFKESLAELEFAIQVQPKV